MTVYPVGHSKADRRISTAMFIQEEKNRAIWRVTLGIACGILLGGVASSVENQACTKSEAPPAYCLTEEPQVRVVNGMMGGAFASGGALLLIELWGRLQKSD